MTAVSEHFFSLNIALISLLMIYTATRETHVNLPNFSSSPNM